MRHLPRIVGTVLGLALGLGGAHAQPVIDSIQSGTLARSARLSIAGTGFGTERGRVLVAGLEAWVSTWTEERIVGYVPEETPFGPSSVVVEVGAQGSNAVPLTVTPRASNGRVRWIFEIDSEYIYYRPAQAPDGTLYVHGYSFEGTGEGRVFAISPDGALLWIAEVNWAAYVPPSAGPDGAAYVGSINSLYRISPTGGIDWEFNSQTIQGSAVVGPDGTVYAGFEQPPEVVALDPDSGALLWENSPGLSAFGTGGNEIRLGGSSPGGPPDRFYIYWDALSAFSFDGDHLFTASAGNVYDHEVGIGSDGTMYAPGNFESALVAHSPFNGSVMWWVDSPWRAGISDVEVGPDDTLYFISDGRWVTAFDPVSRTTLWRHNTGLSLRRPSVSPDGSILLTSGGGNCDSQGCHISFIKAFDTAEGEELWHLELNDGWDPERRDITWDHARISPDSRTAYFTGWLAGGYDWGDERSLLWAIELAETDVFSDGFESGDVSAWGMVSP